MNSITVRNIPDRIKKRLNNRIKITHRSLNSEIIACLEEHLFPSSREVELILEKSEQIRNKLNFTIDLDEIDGAKRQGRK